MPFARVSLKALIPKEYDFEPISGDHIRKKRLKLGLFQREVAQQFGVSPWTIMNWEKGYTELPVSAVSATLEFLGYDPYPEPKTLPERLLAKRRVLGWSIREAAKYAGVDPGTWGRWECGRTILYREHRAIVARFLGLSVDTLDHEMKLFWGQSHKGTQT